ncbi:hypothetical protein [Humibacter sp.]|uniref:hypothetical protein n=1 Tax=Humibacter sp. TaxID=1940291 RepID=UPI003F7D1634
MLTEATQNVEAAVSRAEIIGNRVEQIADTVFGSPHPKATGTTNNAAQGVHFSQSESLRSATQRLFTVLDRLENEVSRLNAL